MPSRIETQLRQLQDEANAQKQAFERAAYSLDLYTTQKTATIPYNHIEASNCAVINNTTGANPSRNALVTFNTYSGIDVVAKIEPYGRRLPYSGGAQWIVPSSGGEESGSGRELTVTVYSTAPGELTVEPL